MVERGQADHGGEKAEEAEKKKGRDGGSRAARPRRQGRRRGRGRSAVLQRLASAARVRGCYGENGWAVGEEMFASVIFFTVDDL